MLPPVPDDDILPMPASDRLPHVAPAALRRRHLLGALAATPLGWARAAGGRVTLTVGAASSLSQAMPDIAALFEAAEASRSGVRVQLSFGASGALLQQAARGAPLDVLASADLETLAQARERGLLAEGAPRVFATNRLVLVVPAVPGPGTAPAVQALADLADPRVQRIALGLPASVPAGRHAQQALQAAGLWPAVQARVVRTASVRQALDYVARGEVDAGFVYATDAALVPGRVRVVTQVPTVSPVAYPAAVLAASAHPARARAFVDFLVDPAAQGVLVARGFGRA